MGKFKKFIISILTFQNILFSQSGIRISEVLFNPDTLEYYCEYIEIYNCSSTPQPLSQLYLNINGIIDSLELINQQGWLQPHQFALILDRGYLDNHIQIYPIDTLQIPVLVTKDNAFGKSGLSNTQETVIRLGFNSVVVDSMTYSPNIREGYSLEKISVCGVNDPLNWDESGVFRGTPGRANSLSPRLKNIALDSVFIGFSDSLMIKIVNEGLSEYSDVISVKVVYLKSDSVIYDSLRVQMSIDLGPGDTLCLPVPSKRHPFGATQCQIVIEAVDDDIADNNWTGILDFGIPKATLIINELMIQSDITGEWIEFYNNSDRPISLFQLQMCDSRDTTIFQSGWIDAGGILVICGEREGNNYFQSYGIPSLYLPKWLTLNNDRDILKIFSKFGPVDSMRYDFSVRQLKLKKEISLERVRLEADGWDLWNWGFSTHPDGHTAGAPNSLLYHQTSQKSQVTFHPNPFSPDGDGYEDVCYITCNFPFPIMDLEIQIYTLDGARMNEYHFPGVSGNFVFVYDGATSGRSKLKIGAYVVYIVATDIRSGSLRKLKKILVSAGK